MNLKSLLNQLRATEVVLTIKSQRKHNLSFASELN